MIAFLEARALKVLWVITFANLVSGLFVWILNFLRIQWAELDPFDNLSRSERGELFESASRWQLFAVPLIEFGILILAITLATAAVVTSSHGVSREAGAETMPEPSDHPEEMPGASIWAYLGVAAVAVLLMLAWFGFLASGL